MADFVAEATVPDPRRERHQPFGSQKASTASRVGSTMGDPSECQIPPQTESSGDLLSAAIDP